MLTENKFGKYLLYAIGEIILVVIGILIALQINNMNESNKSAQQESLYLERLLSENREDVQTFTKKIAELEYGIETIEQLSLALTSDSTSDAQVNKAANDFFGYGSIYPVFTSSTSTFDDLSSTGNLKVIHNQELREQLVKHYAKHKQVAEWIRISTAWALPIDAPFSYHNSIMRFEPVSAFLFGEQSVPDQVGHLKAKKDEYINNAAVHYWVNLDAVSNLKTLVSETTSIIELIEEELEM